VPFKTKKARQNALLFNKKSIFNAFKIGLPYVD